MPKLLPESAEIYDVVELLYGSADESQIWHKLIEILGSFVAAELMFWLHNPEFAFAKKARQTFFIMRTSDNTQEIWIIITTLPYASRSHLALLEST